MVADEVAPVIAACARLLDRGRVLLVCDFDATLAHRSPDPWAARIVPAARRALRRLAATSAVDIALLSGRTVADLAGRVRVGGVTYLGDHGAERADAPRGFRPTALRVRHDPVPADAAASLAAAAAVVPAAVTAPWLVVERKAAAVTFHFRAAPDVDGARDAVLAALDALEADGSLDRVVGRRSVELRPPGAATKASTLAALIEARRPPAVIAMGDGPDDAAAWEAMRPLLARRGATGLAVAVAGYPDVTAAVMPRADHLLASPDELGVLLRHLAARAERVDGPSSRR